MHLCYVIKKSGVERVQPGPPRRLGLYSESNVITAGVRGTSRKSPSTNSFQVLMLKSFRQESQRFQMWALISKAAGEAFWNNPSPSPSPPSTPQLETKAALKNSGLINPLFTAEQLKNNPPSPFPLPLKGNNLPRSTEEQQGNPKQSPHSTLFKGKKASMQTIGF